MEYYESHTKRLLAEFDTTVGRASDLFAVRYGPADAAAMIAEARDHYRTLIPNLPYVGGVQPLRKAIRPSGRDHQPGRSRAYRRPRGPRPCRLTADAGSIKTYHRGRALNAIELWLGRCSGVAGIATLALAIWHILANVSRPAGRQSGPGARFLRVPLLILATLLFAAAMAWLWRPLPLALPAVVRRTRLALGALVDFPSLGIYLWGLRTLGTMFGPSIGFGVRLQAGHRLITDGPYALVRHPMYLAVITAGIGGLLLYRAWAMLLFAGAMFGLTVRAHREEEMLAAEFGAAWEAYCRRVPAWLPPLRRAGER